MQPAGPLLTLVLAATLRYARCAQCNPESQQCASVPPVLIQKHPAQLARSVELLVTARFQACGACARCVVGANSMNQGVSDSHCQRCAMGAQTWWPCNVEGLCECDSSGPTGPDPTPAPTTPAPTSPAPTVPAPTTPAPTAAMSGCGSCARCVLGANTNNQGVSDRQCQRCAMGAQSWWPCNVDGLCVCDSSGPSTQGPTTPAPTTPAPTTPAPTRPAPATPAPTTPAPTTPAPTTPAPTTPAPTTPAPTSPSPTTGLPISGAFTSQGFGAHIEGASVDSAGHVYATHFRDSADETFAGNNAGRNVVGRVSAETGETSAYLVGEEGSAFNGMRWDLSGRWLYLADPGRARVVRVDLATMRAEDHCGADGSLAGTGAPNDLTLAKNGMIYLSGQDWGASTGGLWLCKTDGSVTQLESMSRTNGIALSPNDDFLYLTEAVGSPVASDDLQNGQRIWRYRVDSEAGQVSDKMEFFNFATHPSGPEASIDTDGMRTDTAGNLWATRNGAGKVAVFTPQGSLLREVALTQMDNPTNLAFGGPAGTTLYVVGRCAGAGWGTGNGCVEAVATESIGREWAMLHEGTGGGPMPTTQAPTTQAPTTSAPTTSGAVDTLCGSCDSCVAVTDNAIGQAITDEQCAPCARNTQSWWPCKLGGEWSSTLCKCAGSAGPAPSPAPTGVISPVRPSTPAPTPVVQPATDGSLCSATGPSCDIQPGEGISSWFTKELFDQMFPNLCNAACHGCEMLKYECLIKATSAYPEFANSSSLEDNKRELAAWLGQMSQETTGGGCGASDENADGTCSCGAMWCDGHPGGCSSWGLCFVEEAGGQYCSQSSAYPCKAGREYMGRGPKQLSWNYNYGQFSEEFCGDKNILLDNPDRVASNPTLAWASSMWFWFTGGACLPGENCKPNCHEVFLGTKPMCANDRAAQRQFGLGWVTNVINGGLECGGAGRGKCDFRVHSRVRFYKHFCSILGVNPLKEGWTEDGNLFCHEQNNYVTVAAQTC